jgi:DNA topoisomerase-1
VETAGTTEQEQALYRLIRDRAIASQLADAVYAVRTAMLRSVELVDGGPALYRARGKTLTAPGWKSLYTDDDPGESDDGENPDNPVPALTVGVELDVGGGRVDAKVTKPPKRYTLATLIKALENAGIGRPATYAAILENIQRRSYVAEDSKGLLSATATGELIVDKLVGVCSFVDLDYTRDLEAELDRIAEGKAKYADVVGALHRKLQTELGGIASVPGPQAPTDQGGSSPTVHACNCEKALPLRRNTRPKEKDPKGKGWDFYGCTGYPDCKKTFKVGPDGGPVFDAEPVEKSEAKPRSVPSSEKSPAPAVSAAVVCNCGKSQPLRRNTRTKENDPKGKGWDFYGCTGFPNCKKTFKVGPDGGPVF